MITHLPLRSWSRDEFRLMEQTGLVRPHERAELVEGSVVTRPCDDTRHDAAASHLEQALAGTFADCTVARGATLEPGNASVLQVDLVVRDPMGELILVAEVSSAVTRAYDHHEKASLYAWSGAPEYWLLDLEAGRLEVHRRPAHSRRRPWGWGYQGVAFLALDDEVRPLHGQHPLKVEDLFTP